MTAVLGEALMTDALSVTRLQAEAPNQPPMGPLWGARTEEAVLPTTGACQDMSAHTGDTLRLADRVTWAQRVGGKAVT